MSIAPSASAAAHLTLLTLLSAATFYCFYKSRRLKLASKNPNAISPSRGKLFFISETGTSKTLATRLLKLLQSNGLQFDLVDTKDYEPEDLCKETVVLIVASTWEDGKAPAGARFFVDWIRESADDFRVGALLLNKCRFAVFGVGSRSYGEERFNAVSRDLSKWVRGLGADEVLPVCEGDVDEGDLDEVFDGWSRKVVERLKGGLVENGEVREVVLGCESDEEFGNGSDEEDDYDEGEGEGEEDGEIVDLEDLAGRGPTRKSGLEVSSNGKGSGEKEMVTPIIRASLEKQVRTL